MTTLTGQHPIATPLPQPKPTEPERLVPVAGTEVLPTAAAEILPMLVENPAWPRVFPGL